MASRVERRRRRNERRWRLYLAAVGLIGVVVATGIVAFGVLFYALAKALA